MDKIEETLKFLKENKKEEHLSEEFKNNLKNIMDIEYAKEKKKFNFKMFNIKNIFNKFKNNSLILSKKFIVAFSCFILISGCAFGGEICNMLTKIFSNEDKSVQLAIENGYVQNVNMDYVEHNGFKMKVDYVYADDSCIYIAFDVKSNQEFDEVLFKDIVLKNENNEIVYDEEFSNIRYETQVKRINKKNEILLVRFYKISGLFINFNELTISCDEIVVKNRKAFNIVQGNWKFIVDVNNNSFCEEINYCINSRELIEDYSFQLKNYRLNIYLKFKNDFMKKVETNRENIYLEDNIGNIYNINDIYSFSDNTLEIIFPIDRGKNINNFKLKIKCCNEKEEEIVLYLNKI